MSIKRRQLLAGMAAGSAALDFGGAKALGAQGGSASRTGADRSIVSVRDFGAIGDGIVDDAQAINAALASGCTRVDFPDGRYRVAQPLLIDGSLAVSGSPGAVVVADPGLDLCVVVGSRRLFDGHIEGLKLLSGVSPAASRATGFAFRNCVEATFSDCEARNFALNFRAQPQVGERVGYCLWINAQAIGGIYNFSQLSSDGSWVNENVFLGGRAVTAAHTIANVHWPDGNHTRFIGMSCEGVGEQALFVGGHSNLVLCCRTEGEWTLDDIVIAPGALYTHVVQVNPYTTVTDNGQHSHIETGLQGASQAIGIGSASVQRLIRTGARAHDVPILDIDDKGKGGSGAGVRTNVVAGNKSGYHLLCVDAETSSLRAQIDTDGNFYSSASLRAGSSAYDAGGLHLGSYRLWFDAGGNPRIGDGEPQAADDGALLSRKVDPPESSRSAGADGEWAADEQYIYVYIGDGNGQHRWRRSRLEEF